MLKITNLSVVADDTPLLHNISLDVGAGQTHLLMGPNGSGKSTLALTLMGHSQYTITNGSLFLHSEDITTMPVHKRAQRGLFLSFQQPPVLPGVQVFTLLKEACHVLRQQPVEVDVLYDELCDYMDLLGIDHSFAQRNVNEGFSGGEKKRFELLQLLLLKPKLAVLDEIDSGLDVDGIKLLQEGLLLARECNPDLSFLIISHYQKSSLFERIAVDAVHVLKRGHLVAHGDVSLCTIIEKQGFDGFWQASI